MSKLVNSHGAHAEGEPRARPQQLHAERVSRDKQCMRAVILVAGVSRRLFPLTEHLPKCLLDMGGSTIFDRQVSAIRAAGIREVALVVGYRREQLVEHARRRYPDVDFTVVVNHLFFDTNTAYSLWAAADAFLDRDFVLMNGDVLFEPRLLERVLESPHAAALAVERKPCGDEEVKVICDDSGRIQTIGKELDPARSLGEFIGVARFNATLTSAFYRELDSLHHRQEHNAYFEAALDAICDKHPLHAVDVTEFPCIEIDFPEDYDKARTEVLARFEQ